MNRNLRAFAAGLGISALLSGALYSSPAIFMIGLIIILAVSWLG